MVNLVRQELSRRDIADLKAYQRYISILQNIIIEAQSSITMLNSFLDPTLSLTPGDRLKLIIDLDKQSREQMGKDPDKDPYVLSTEHGLQCSSS